MEMARRSGWYSTSFCFSEDDGSVTILCFFFMRSNMRVILGDGGGDAEGASTVMSRVMLHIVERAGRVTDGTRMVEASADHEYKSSKSYPHHRE